MLFPISAGHVYADPGNGDGPVCTSSAGMHVYGATDSIDQLDIQAVYYVARDREPLPDWHERLTYHLERAKKFHEREFCGQSEFTYTIHPSPFVASATRCGFPQDDVNRFYWHVINEVWHSGDIEFTGEGFPILLVLSDVNFSPGYDDWTRTCDGKTCIFPPPHSECSGYVKETGEDRPGTRCGGARSVFWPEKHIGLGLVTADGWRVPIEGTACVVYHEGIGHAIGLPHPEPINNSVMGLAQYVDSINNTWIDDDQKEALGWQRSEVDRSDLFSTFQISHRPTNPSATQTITITATFSERSAPVSLAADYQLSLRDSFHDLGEPSYVQKGGEIRATWDIPPMPTGASAGYRVHIQTESGVSEEIWGYLNIRN